MLKGTDSRNIGRTEMTLMPKDINKEKSISRARNLTQLVICAVILGFAGYNVYSAYENMHPVPSSSYVKEPEETTVDEPTEPDPDKVVYSYAAVPTQDKFYGELILVNNDHEYFSLGDEDLVNIADLNSERGIDCFTVAENTYTILRPVYDPMVQMIEDFYDLYHNDTLQIYGSYRSKKYQQEIYDRYDGETDDDGFPRAAVPGKSEHETGYAFDFTETTGLDYQGQGDFAWINTNCYKYGFVVRYTEEKEKITQIRSEPWHFRYVGIAHATYMTKNDHCLEEYIDLLRDKYTYEGEHLEVTDDDGAHYEIFYVPSDDGSETTNVPVPSGCRYDISGNNSDGFIVTVHKDEKTELGQETAEPETEATTEPDEDTDSDSDTE
ncbi:MAG: M15 family metallopeptidase [Ruminococcus sp.]|nr:M15 family metallopeptidase [Ruminococcus sp.]